MIYCKTLDEQDYGVITEIQHAQNINNMLISRGAAHRFEHPHRAWEYGIVLHALRENNTDDVLDVGGGGSAFAPMCAWLDMEVVQVDPGDCAAWVERQNIELGLNVRYKQLDFYEFKHSSNVNNRRQTKWDAVTCISTLEHIPTDVLFFKKLLTHVRKNGLVAITVDFHPLGEQMLGGHLRTYREVDLVPFIMAADEAGFDLFGKDMDYVWRGPAVNDYTFASLIMKRVR